MPNERARILYKNATHHPEPSTNLGFHCTPEAGAQTTANNTRNLEEALKAGQVTPLDGGQYKCEVCNKKYVSKATVKSHLTTKTHLTKLPKVSSTQTASQATERKIQLNSAPQQDVGESSHNSFDAAVKAGHVTPQAEGRYRCNVCNKDYASKASVRNHLTTKIHLTRLIPATPASPSTARHLSSVPSNSASSGSVVRHETSEPPLEESIEVEKGEMFPYSSDQRVKDSAKRKSRQERLAAALKKDQVTPLPDGSYKCEVCSREYVNKSSIKQHLFTNIHREKLQNPDKKKTKRKLKTKKDGKLVSSSDKDRDVPLGVDDLPCQDTTDSLEERKGAKMDSINIQNTFTKFGYQVYIHENLTEKETFKELENIKKSCSQEPPQAFFVFFLSHGVPSSKEFMAADGKPLNIDSIKNEFTNDRCPALAKKPKIFLTNYCRGNNEEWLETDGLVKIPQDIVTIYASMDGIVAYRQTDEGTTFVLSLCRVMERLRERTELHHFYLMLQNEMKRNRATTPVWEELCFKKFYLEIPERK
ncbi:zinc finger and BTB domain-containing protein 2-like isoform X4 [Scylla paramamosain]|uniref:zinc finger and BTB domain-containing protein 2-like isoform X4 n=1 Tax=Scylla paramamosain TaxID=85552 RepID=UPI003083504E